MDNTPFPKLAAVRNAPPSTQALLRKLVHDPLSAVRSSGQTKSINLNRFTLEKISNQTAQDTIDSDSIMQVLPDLELVEQILVGSILSPKDMSSADINISVAENQFNGAIAGLLLEVPTRHFKHDYKIDERLDIQLENILTKHGSHILVVLPENNVDAIINGRPQVSMEDYKQAYTRMQSGKALGFLGHPSSDQVSLENFDGSLEDISKVRDKGGKTISHITVTDNFNVLKTPDIKKRMRSLQISKRISQLDVSMEDGSFNLTSEQIDALYQNRGMSSKAVEVVAPQAYMDKPSVGHPLTLEMPAEAVVPVFVPGKPDEHVGYFILLDIFGRPVSKNSQRDYYNEMRSSFKANQKDNSSELLRLTREAMGTTDNTSVYEVEQIQQTYATILENDIQNRLRNGLYDEEFEIGFSEEVSRLMLYRKFKQQNTQLLYIPVELVSYIAFNYNADGIGQTLLAKSKILSNMRSVLLFAEIMGGVRNAVGRKKVNVTLDPDDPDKTDTVAKVQELIMETSRLGFPIGAPDPAQSLDYLTRAGYDFAINADSEDYGQTKVEYDDYTTNIQAGNPDLQDRLRRMQVSGLGVPPEKVDPTASPDFAVGVVQNDLIMTRRVKRYQKIFCHGQTKFVRTYTRNSSKLIDEMVKLIEGNKDLLTDEQKTQEPGEIVRQFIDALTVKLPEPDTTRIDLMNQAFDQYNDLLEKALDAYITPDLFPDESFEGASSAADRFKNIISAFFRRQYMAQNNVLPELNVLHEMNGEKPAFSILDVQNGYMAAMGTAFHEFLKTETEKRDEWKEKYPPAEEPGFGGEETPFGDGELEDGSTSEEDTGELSLDDDFAPPPDLDEPVSEEEEPSTDETPEGETEEEEEIPTEEESAPPAPDEDEEPK